MSTPRDPEFQRRYFAESVHRRTYIIAEAGVNHGGDEGMALELVAAAAEAGADAVKFQTFTADALATRSAHKAAYQKTSRTPDERQFDMLRRLQLGRAAQHALRDRCGAHGVDFLSSPFDVSSVHFLVSELGLRVLKVPSGELTNGPLLLEVARARCSVILSTGMSTLSEVEAALRVLAFGYTNPEEAPGDAQLRAALASVEGKEAIARHVVLMHCTTAYPTPHADVNLRMMDALKEAFGLRVGLSDHTVDGLAALAAVARGAPVLEKHFTLDRSLVGPDHAASLDPLQFRELVDALRTVEAILGSCEKVPVALERANMAVARKSLVARRPIALGEVFDADNLTAKRPGTGMSPMYTWRLLGRTASRSYDIDDLIDE